MENEARKQRRKTSPRATCSVLSILTYAWTIPLFNIGYKKDLEISDLYEPLEEHKSGVISDEFERLWNEEKKRKSPSLFRAFMRYYLYQYLLMGFAGVLLDIMLRFVQPISIGRLIRYFVPGQTAISLQEAYLNAAIVVGVSGGVLFIVHPYLMGMQHMGMKIRLTCCSLIYRKSLRLSQTTFGEITMGQVVNLISNDVGRLDFVTWIVHNLWMGPMMFLGAMYIMWQEIGACCVVGFIFILSFVPLQLWFGKLTSKYRLRTAVCTDERLRLMNGIISGIQVIKMYTWEEPFAKLVEIARRNEIKVLRVSSYIRGVNNTFGLFVARSSILLSILVYVVLGNHITAERMFVVTACYGQLQRNMIILFPLAISGCAEMMITFKRIEKFLLQPELQSITYPQANSKANSESKPSAPKSDAEESLLRNKANDNGKRSNNDTSPGGDKHLAIYLDNVTAKWLPKQSDSTLSNITIQVKVGSLVAVIGSVGSGKSSLLSVILKELTASSGSVNIRGKVGYASQEPWLFSESIRQNILFGSPMDRDRYDTVVKRCALERDFSLFADGDLTIVGDRGISLSGGQRARVSLARTVYRKADIYLFDDPLSAVDATVSRQVFDTCIKDYLSGTTRILVTHQMQFLSEVDHIIILDDGAVGAEGTFESLQASGLDFAKLLKKDDDEEEAKADELETKAKDTKVADEKNEKQISTINSSKGPAINEEQAVKGSVGSQPYKAYINAAGSRSTIAVFALLALTLQAFISEADYWSSYWVNKEQLSVTKYLSEAISTNETSETLLFSNYSFGLERPLVDAGGWYLTRGDFVYIYTGIIIMIVVLGLCRSFMFFWMAMQASKNLHSDMFNAVTRACMRFFHNNPSGRILNRFSKDIGSIDELLPQTMIDVINISLTVIGVVAIVITINYWMVIPAFIMLFIFSRFRVYYLATSRSIKRLEGITRSPVISHLSSSLQGMATIRAFSAERALEREFDSHQDQHSSAWFMFISTSRAFGFWLDFLCVAFLGLITFSFLVIDTSSLGGSVGLAITQVVMLSGIFQWGMRQSSEMENHMTCVERVIEYNSIEKEAALISAPGKKPAPSWPALGGLVFRDVWLRYSPDGEPALRGLSFNLQPQEKLGIVGRTGAGKTSIISVLFRLAYTEGTVLIDGIDIGTIGLHDLRSKLAIIPQEPVLFSGPMRKNLDPFDEYSDEVLWKALEEVELKETVSELKDGLSSIIQEGGSNFSVGQRQLVCLARAIIRKNRILVLDEATANVDPQTDDLIQKTIKMKFAECTVLTIAHRLNTVIDSDKILVMDAGTMMEFDHPHHLLQNEKGFFRAMVNQTGKSMSDILTKKAQQNYENLSKDKTD